MVKADIITREKISSQFAENPILNKMAEHKADGYYKETPRYKEIVWGGVSHKIPKRAMNIDDVVFQRGFYLFAAVKNNVRQYLEKNNNVLPELKEYPVNHTNYDFDIDNLDILGVDLTAAYWYIARNLGFISQKVFSGAMKKISVEFNGETKEGDLLKPMRLSALSILGRSEERRVGKEC